MVGQRIGYTRVSTVAQTLDQQNDALARAGVSKTFSDNMSGACDDRLLALGARIRALPADQLDSFEIYRTPKPLERRIKPAVGDPIHSYEEFFADPEDDPQQAPEPAKPRRALA